MRKRLEKICKKIALLPWKDIRELGVNMKKACRIKKGETVNFREATLERLEADLK